MREWDTSKGILLPREKAPAMPQPFHLALHVDDLTAARDFYGRVLGCAEGRATDTGVDFDFFGHQISLHLGQPSTESDSGDGALGEVRVPMPHFGPVLDIERFQALAERLRAAGVTFVIPPTVRYKGQPDEQWTMFFRDPSGNPIEAKGLANQAALFDT